jgi:hypothetical protein
VFNCCHFFSHGATNEYHSFFKLGETTIETYELFQTVCGDEALSSSSGFDCLNDLKAGLSICRMTLSTSRNADTIANVREIAT